jgi:8-oxo-dGTP pyrophosphatase MutT (NUDIX family)
VVVRAHLYLAEYNLHWKTFTLPMTRLKRRTTPGTSPRESPEEAALRAAAEAVGRPLPPHGLPRRVELDLPPHHLTRSGRDDQTKHYTYHVFTLRVTDPTLQHALGRHTIWLKRDDFLTHQPVSPSAVFIWQRLGEDQL